MEEEQEDVQEDVKNRMRRFIASDNALRRPKVDSGIIISFAKFVLIVGLIGGAIYGVYIWHPWKTIADTTDGPNVGGCEYGYETVRATEILGFRFGEKKSVLCKEDMIVE